jgi:hypothetical protein
MCLLTCELACSFAGVLSPEGVGEYFGFVFALAMFVAACAANRCLQAAVLLTIACKLDWQ